MTPLHIQTLSVLSRPLAHKFYRAQHSPMRAHRQDRVWVALQPEIVAALCLRPIPPGHWLTGLLVAPDYRRQGIARRLLEQALAETEGPAWLFCAPELDAFYRRLGFARCLDLPPVLAERLARYRRSKPLIALCR